MPKSYGITLIEIADFNKEMRDSKEERQNNVYKQPRTGAFGDTGFLVHWGSVGGPLELNVSLIISVVSFMGLKDFSVLLSYKTYHVYDRRRKENVSFTI